MHHFLYQKMQTCSEIEKFIQRNAKTDICRSWRFLIRDLFYSPLYYDVKFAPTEHRITLDYPVFGLDMTLEGIDRISQYVDAVYEEQRWLMQFPRTFVIDALRSFHPRYEAEYFNLKEIVELQL